MSCCNRPPVGGPKNSDMGKIFKGLLISLIIILTVAYIFG